MSTWRQILHKIHERDRVIASVLSVLRRQMQRRNAASAMRRYRRRKARREAQR